MAKRRIMKEFSITEISGVDRPAQAHARTVIMKRDDKAQENEMTPEEKAKMEALAAEKEAASKKAAEAEAAAKKLTDDLAVAKALAEMTDAQKVYYNKQDAAGKETFLKMSADKRTETLAAIEKAAKEDNPVVYTATDGTAYRKSDDPRLVSMAQKQDADRKEREAAVAKAEGLEFTKRAETELNYLPGDVQKVKVPLLRAISKMDDESRKGAEALLAAANKSLSGVMTTIGFGADPRMAAGGAGITKRDANAELDKMAQDHAKATGLSYAKAYDAVAQTPRGKELYASTLAAA